MIKILGVFQNNTLPDVETERLVLRQRTLDDVDDMFTYGSLECVAHAAGFKPSQTTDDTVLFLQSLYERLDKENIPRGYGITLKGSHKVIGSVDFNRRYGNTQHILEIGYALHPDYWGQGIMPEAVKALIEVTFTLLSDIQKIGVSHYAFNKNSKRVIEKIGFKQEGIQRATYYLDGVYHDEVNYGLLRKEWEERGNRK